MTRHSSIETEDSQTAAYDVPLSERPLVADSPNTVVSTGSDHASDHHSIEYNTAGQGLIQQLFSGDGSDRDPEGGLRIAHFEVHERIGSGGMGAVFRATDVDLAREVALKVLHPSVAADSALVSRFRNEARACARLNHDNIARVYYTGQQDGIHFIAYEYANGRTFKELTQQRGVLTSSETVNYAIQATLALNHIFAAGIVHRDIKPSNIILTDTGRVKIVDLGLARRESTDSIGDITVAGTTLGTFDYISPEQARDPRTADVRSDIYSLGCTMYHMLTGQPPYPEGTAVQKLLDHQGKAPPDPATLNPKIEPDLAFIVQKMMSTQPDERYQDPGQLLTDLMDLATAMGLRSIPAEGIVWQRVERPSIRHSSGSIFLFASVLVVCIAALIIQLTPTTTMSPGDDDLLGELTEEDTSVSQAGGDTSAIAPTEQDNSESTDTESVAMAAVDNENSESAGSVPVPPDDRSATTPTDNATGGNSATGNNGSQRNNGPQNSASPVQGNTVTSGGPFEIRSVDGSPRKFTQTLSAALSAAEAGDTIRLRFNGTSITPLRDLSRLNRESVKLQAAEGFRPILEFDGDRDSGTPASMFELVNNSSLTIVGVGLRLTPQLDISTDPWCVFDCVGPNQVVLQDVSIEINNPGEFPASVFRMQDSRVSEDGDISTDCRLTNVAVRGAVDLFYIAGQATGNVTINNSGFALEGSFIESVGSSSMQHAKGDLQFSLERVTCLLSQPLIQMQDSDTIPGNGPERMLPAVQVTSNACVFAAINGAGTLVQSRGNAYIDSLQELLTWRGDTNLFHGFDWFWHLESGEADFTTVTLNQADWHAYWEKPGAGLDESTVAFEWSSPRWKDSSNATDVSRMTNQWLRLDQSLFRGSEATLPLFEGREIPGVASETLPAFYQPGTQPQQPQSLTD
jgi:serine/threonine-protein kinase